MKNTTRTKFGKGIGLREIQGAYPTGFVTGDTPLNYIDHLFCPEPDNRTFDLDLSPPYQRGHVWTYKQASSFVGFMLRAGRGAVDLYPT